MESFSARDFAILNILGPKPDPNLLTNLKLHFEALEGPYVSRGGEGTDGNGTKRGLTTVAAHRWYSPGIPVWYRDCSGEGGMEADLSSRSTRPTADGFAAWSHSCLPST